LQIHKPDHITLIVNYKIITSAHKHITKLIALGSDQNDRMRVASNLSTESSKKTFADLKQIQPGQSAVDPLWRCQITLSWEHGDAGVVAWTCNLQTIV
jgi:hypothetical protein